MSCRLASQLDPFSPEFRSDPYAAYEELRGLGPFVWLEQHGIWCVHHYDTCMKVLSDYAVFSNAGGGGIKNYFQEKPWRSPSIILEVDPPDHTRTRTVMNRVLSPRILEGLREGGEGVAGAMVAEARAKARIEAVEDLSRRFPLRVFPDNVGLAEDDRHKLLTYGARSSVPSGPRATGIAPSWPKTPMCPRGSRPCASATTCRRTASER